jgi:hypothetical protein
MENCRVLWLLCPLCRRGSQRARWSWNLRGSAHSTTAVSRAEKVVVVHKTSRLDFEKMKRPEMTDRDIARMLTEGGVDYEYLRERHVTHNKSLHEIYSYLE